MTRAHTGPVRVLVAERSQAEREQLVYLLNADPGLQVVGAVGDGEQALAGALRLQPDVIMMDMHLPKMDGFAVTRKIMENCPTRILMMAAATASREVAETFQTLEAGALTVVAKPQPPGHSGHQAAVRELLSTIKLMAEVPVVKRWKRTPQRAESAASTRRVESGIGVVVIGASTGGPLVLQTILARLPRDFSAPILIVQHISAGFSAGLIEWLGRTTGYPIRLAQHGEPAQAGIAYMAPDDAHMLIRADRRIVLSKTPPEHGMRPAVSCLFRSAAEEMGPRAAGVLLTGMGRDGAQELKEMQQTGAVTMVQDKASAVVYGMPGEAQRLDAATYVLPPEGIASMLEWLVTGRRKG